MKRKIVVYRFQFEPTSNMRMAEALVEFYREDQMEAFMFPTLYGVVSNFITRATPEEIFQKITAANVGNHFTVIELDANDVPIKTITSAGAEIFVGESSTTATNVSIGGTGTVDHSFIDSRMTNEELEAELNRLLDKVQAHGVKSLSKQEKARLDHLSQR